MVSYSGRDIISSEKIIYMSKLRIRECFISAVPYFRCELHKMNALFHRFSTFCLCKRLLHVRALFKIAASIDDIKKTVIKTVFSKQMFTFSNGRPRVLRSARKAVL